MHEIKFYFKISLTLFKIAFIKKKLKARISKLSQNMPDSSLLEIRNQIFSIHSLQYAEAFNEFAGSEVLSLFVLLHLGSTALFEKMLPQSVPLVKLSDFAGQRFEPHTSGSRNESVTAFQNF